VADSVDELTIGQRLRFEFGTTLQLELEGVAGRTPALLLGRSGDEFLIVQLGSDTGAVINRLFKGSTLVGRYVHDGTVYGFQSRSLGNIASPSRLLFIAFPVIVAVQSLRSTERFPCILPATVTLGADEMAALLMDISGGGCLFRYRPETGEDSEEPSPPDVNAEVVVQLRLPGQADAIELPGSVRASRVEDGKVTVGVQFGEPEEDAVALIDEFIGQLRAAG
jgi:hypothetical protein